MRLIVWIFFWISLWTLILRTLHRMFPRRPGYRLATYGAIIVIVAICSLLYCIAIPPRDAISAAVDSIEFRSNSPGVGAAGFAVLFVWLAVAGAFTGIAVLITLGAFTLLEVQRQRQRTNGLSDAE